MNRHYQQYVTIIHAPVRRVTDVTRLIAAGWDEQGATLVHVPLEATEYEAARAEAQAIWPDRRVVIPRLGELPTPSHLRVIKEDQS